MITQEQAEKFLQSKLALFVGMLIVMGFLFGDRYTLTSEIKQLKKEKRESDSIHRLENNANAKIIYSIQQQQKIDADNAIQAEKYRTEKYENLYLQVKEVREAAEKHKILK